MNSTAIQLMILFMLILVNAFFAGTEIAFISLNQGKINVLAQEGSKRAKKLQVITESPSNFLSAIQIGVTLSSILSGALASDAFSDGLTNWIVSLSNGALSMHTVKPVSVILITLTTMYLMLVFGELVPKRVAMAHTEGFALLVVYPIWIIATLFTPIVKLLSMSTNLILRIVGIDPNKVEEITEEEIRLLIEQGEIDIVEKEMIENVFEFDNLEVSDIMTHRTDIIAFDIDTSFEELMDLVHTEPYTRYPVYEESIDNIIGIFHLRDLLSFIHAGRDPEKFNFRKAMREPYFVPESKRTDELFAELKLYKTHIAVVIDEYGGTAGIITMEDLIEEVMGNIMDEYDEDEEELITTVHEGEFLVEGYADLEDLEDVIKIGLPIEDYDTVSGFVIGEMGRLPSKEDINNEASNVVYNGYLFSIIDIDEKVVSKVRVLKVVEEVKGED